MKMYNHPTFDSGIVIKGRKWYKHGSEPFFLKSLMYMGIAILITLQQIYRHLWPINSFVIRISIRILLDIIVIHYNFCSNNTSSKRCRWRESFTLLRVSAEKSLFGDLKFRMSCWFHAGLGPTAVVVFAQLPWNA